IRRCARRILIRCRRWHTNRMASAAATGKKVAILKAEKLEKTYRIGKVDVPALRGVSLEVEAGEFVAVMGPSGCGKSTMLHLLGGLLTPTKGRIIIDGEDLTAASDAKRTDIRRRKIGFVFQRFNLFPTLTADGNLRLAERIHGNGAGDPERRREILGMLRLEDKMHHKPLELSGGEQQRVALARAVITQPAIVLADEPTGNLDSENSAIVLNMFQELNRRFNQTIIMITHNPEAAAACGRIIQMRDGHIVAA
ncbi:MAG TPA: ABC transporter ATP-binding protein, partial [Pyrinomonadaceae bacterium]|nr:ABC transporter ATP-binding protein [Pyrinomonadaceae bacterium]